MKSNQPDWVYTKPNFKEKAKGKLFKNKFLEKLTRTSIEIPIVMHTIIAMVFVYLSFSLVELTILTVISVFLFGILSWTLLEYWIHRVVYHTKTENKFWLKIQYLGHGVHHEFPNDKTRLAMPPVPALFLISLFFGVFWLIGGKYAFAFFPGFLVGYVLYIGLHYAQHRIRKPKLKPFKKLWELHALHHFKHPDMGFGVSTLLWDYVFGTMPK